MSDVAGGPGWWQASDGKWYPPESMSPQPPPGVYPPPGVVHAAPPAKSNTTLVVVIVALCLAPIVVAALAVVCIIAITFLGHSASSKFSYIGPAEDPAIAVPLDLAQPSGTVLVRLHR